MTEAVRSPEPSVEDAPDILTPAQGTLEGVDVSTFLGGVSTQQFLDVFYARK